jgi:flagellar motor switch protein FliM
MAGISLNPDEINALMSAIHDGRSAPEAPKSRGSAVPYDLTSQDRVIRGQMPTLDAINEQIASAFGVGIAGRTRLSVRVTCGPSSLLRFGDFNSLLAPPATVCVLSLGKAGAQALLVLEPGLGDAMIAAALGDKSGKPDDPSPTAENRRELTNVERSVLRRLVSIFTEAMGAAWAPVLPFRPEVVRFETDPRLAVISPVNEAAVLCSFELDGAIHGLLQLAIPYTAVEPARKALTSPPKLSSSTDSRFATQLTDEICQVPVELRVELGRNKLTLRRVLELEEGDVLTLGTSEGVSLPVFVEGRAKLKGQPVIEGGSVCLRIVRGPVNEIRRPFENDPESDSSPKPNPQAA